MERVGFVGLGVMGAPMAGHLERAGHEVWVWNRTVEKSAGFARVASSLLELGEKCTVLITCVGKTEDVEQVLAGLLATAAPQTLFVDHSTIAPEGARTFHKRCRAHGCAFVDAPVTGGSRGAQLGTLTIFCGGEEADVERARPYLSAYGKRVERVGEPGAGQMMKVANQIAVAGSLLALCESLAFAEKAGLDLAQTRELVGSGAAGSWAFENYGPKILARDWSPGFSVKNQRKDLGYCEEAAAAVGASIPGALLTDELLAELEAEGHGEWTTAALFEVLLRRRNA